MWDEIELDVKKAASYLGLTRGQLYLYRRYEDGPAEWKANINAKQVTRLTEVLKNKASYKTDRSNSVLQVDEEIVLVSSCQNAFNYSHTLSLTAFSKVVPRCGYCRKVSLSYGFCSDMCEVNYELEMSDALDGDAEMYNTLQELEEGY